MIYFSARLDLFGQLLVTTFSSLSGAKAEDSNAEEALVFVGGPSAGTLDSLLALGLT